MLQLTNKTLQKQYQNILTASYNTLKLKGDLVLELEFVDSDTIKQINNEHRGKDKSTDVLSFGFLELAASNIGEYQEFSKENYPLDFDEEYNAVFIGSVVICKEIAIAQAKEYGQSEKEEIEYLLVHAILHLLGHDHEIVDIDKKLMRALEEKILNR